MNTVDEYIGTFPENVQAILQEMRRIIMENAPDATELMSYGIPGYKTQGKPLVYFGGYRKHIGFYATPNGQSEFAQELSAYKQGRGSVQFPLDQPMPWDLIRRIVLFRAQKNVAG